MDTTPTPATIAAGTELLKQKAQDSGFGFAIATMPPDKIEAFVVEFATAILKAQAGS
jgi:hypothetical protein